MSFQQKRIQDENRIRDALIDTKTSLYSENPPSVTPFGRDQWVAGVLALQNPSTDIEGYLNSLEASAWKGFMNFSEATKSAIDDAYDWLVEDFVDLTSTIWTNLTNEYDFLNTLQSTLAGLSDDVISTIADLTDEAETLLSDPAAWVLTQANAIWDSLKETANWLSGEITGAISWLSTEIGDVADAIWTNLTSTAGWLSDQVTGVLGDVWTNITTFFTTVGAELTSLLNNPVSWLTGKATEIWNSIISDVDWLFDEIGDVADAIWTSLTSTTDWLLDQVTDVLGDTWTNVTTFFATVGTELTSLLNNPIEWLEAKGTEIGTALTTSLGATWTALTNLSDDFISTIENLSTEATTLLSNPGTWLAGKISTIAAALIGLDFVYADTGTQTAEGSSGDIDMKTYDITNVDRVFFNSNNGIDGASDHPHISGLASSALSGYLGLFAPTGFSFFVGNTDSVLTILQNSVSVIKPATFLQNIRVGSGTSTMNGNIGLNGDDVIIRSGGKDVNISLLGPDPTTTIKIKNSPTYANPGNTNLNTEFGDERGSIGLWCDEDLGTGEASKVYLWVKSENDWFGIQANSIVQTTQNLDGDAYDGSSIQKRVKTTTSSNQAPLSSLVGTEDNGRLFCHQQSNDPDDGSFGIVVQLSTVHRVYGHRFDTSNVNEVTTTDNDETTQELLNKIPIIAMSSSNESTSSLDEGFGIEEGSLGYNTNTDKFYAKINGYWWRWDFGLLGA